MKSTIARRSNCPLSYGLEEFGDVWSLLIIRDVMLFGKKTYVEFLASNEKIATNILVSRLQKLVAKGILQKKAHRSDKRKDIYRLTAKGRALYPIMKEIMLWSKKYDSDTGLADELARALKKEDQAGAIRAFLHAGTQRK